ncbi:AmmeMemoRadiSam system radical SAM enzyme [Butyrivibrio sp. AE3004]|uniref:AmmeMemoRadiSam system radical SAM enzyme n=1 Tax=Butyrivibrio sp. AE3004 TaxID=1506994 RepID=UPI0004947A50|nr:AmmeMemoRadiSam system radical SAM enzyme [Butyrivibrio sp. AE3004]
MPTCNVCHHRCNIAEGSFGLCHARTCKDGRIFCANYGHVTSIALDPIEKKPLSRFFPGSNIVSVGSYGCNLRCPFCQNYSISYGFADEGVGYDVTTPQQLVNIALEYKNPKYKNIGIAFTYNEPLVGFEFVRDTARLSHENGLKNVLVSNGNVTGEVCDEILPFIDAMNIDLKGFTDKYYSEVLKGDRKMVMDFIEKSSKSCHMEVTTLIVPGYNDTPEEISDLAAWLSELGDITLHITRYFPRFRMTDVPATDVELIYLLADTARQKLKYVYTGNC